VLTTASHEKYANQIADYLGIFDKVIASDRQTNFSGAEKHQRLVERFGKDQSTTQVIPAQI